MAGSTAPDSAFDEQRVLAELERLQAAIRARRAARALAHDGLDIRLQASETSPAPPLSHDDRRAAAVVPGQLMVDAVVARRGRPALLAGVIAVLVVGVAIGWVITHRVSGPAGAPFDQTAVPVGAAVPPPAASGPAVPEDADPHPLRIELTTGRRVWLRVTVDGQMAIEREVGAGERLPFGADRAIVVRLGDAGAVSIRVGGVNQGPAGRDGQVITRAFAAPGR